MLKDLVFISEIPWERPAKISMALRRLGISPLLIFLKKPNNFDPRNYFEHSIQLESPEEVVGFVKKLKPSLIHHFSYGADQVGYYLFANRPKCPIVYDYKDCFEGLINPPHTDIFMETQRMFVLSADGLCCRDLQLWNYCRVNNLKPGGRRTLFLDYCWGQGKPSDDLRVGAADDVHTVIAGNFTIEKLTPGGSDMGYLHIARALAINKIHVHIYPRWHFAYFKDRSIDFLDYIELESISPYVHLHEPVAMDAFLGVLSQYDYGLGLLQGALFPEIGIKSNSNRGEQHNVSTRWYDYIDAGLDVLASPEFKFMYRIARNAGASFPLTNRDLSLGDLRERLIQRKVDKFERNILARDRLNINNHIGELIDFYDLMIKS